MSSTTLRFSAVVLVCLSAVGAAAGQTPDEVQDLSWCPGATDCLTWSAVDSVMGYNLYRGSGGTLPGVLDDALDSCTVGTFAENVTGSAIVDPVAPGELQWFLVTAFNPFGEGSGGEGTSGTRVLDSTGICVSGGGLVINEVDYDQVGTDSAEFVEIFNAGATSRELAGLVLILVNGLSSAEYARVDLGEAGVSLGAGEYLVVGSGAVVGSLPPGTLSVEFSSSTNNMQNGAPDGVALFDTATTTLIDALSYEGAIHAAQFDGVPGTFDLVEGTAATAADSNSLEGALGRFPDGADSGDDDSDWRFIGTVSPGAANPAP